MSNQGGNAQHPLAMPSDEIRRLQSEMALLTTHIARLTDKQITPLRAQHPKSAGPSNATATGAGRCYFCQRSPNAGGDCPAVSPTEVANAFGETLRLVNDDVSIIEAWPFPMSTAAQSLKIGILREVHLCRALVSNFPGEEMISLDDDDEE
uniref:Uncharacterized protein n=1 Tax=Romanomermis culicivorax TaxID=13658 RepID=A0A915KSV3_ROMCU